MSLYRFFASDKEMPELDNMHVTPGKANNSISVIDENHALRIKKENDLYYASQYTDKEFVNYIEWHYNDGNAEIIIDYIKDLLKNRFSLFLYNTWNDDKSPVNVTKINVNDLSVQDIKKLWGQESFSNNECLQIYKEY